LKEFASVPESLAVPPTRTVVVERMVVTMGLALLTLRAKKAVCDREPLVAVTATVKLPAVVEVHVRVALVGEGGNVTLLGVIVPQLRPEGTVSDNDTVPEKVDVAVNVLVEAIEEPRVPDGEVAEMEKSGETKVNCAIVE